MSPQALAKELGVSYKHDVLPLLTGHAATLAEIDRDEVMLLIKAHVAERIGLLMAIQHEMDKALHKDVIKRIARTERFKDVTERRKPNA